jgi:AraC-like DNA-binding protein
MHFCQLSEKSQILSGCSLGDAVDYSNQHAGSHRVFQNRINNLKVDLKHAEIGGLELFQMCYGDRAAVLSHEREGLYHVHLVLKGLCSLKTGGEEHILAPGELLLINPDSLLDLTYSDNYEKLIVKIPARLVHEVCNENRWSYSGSMVRFAPLYRTAKQDSLIGLLDLVCQEADSSQSHLQVGGRYARLLISKLLSIPGSNIIHEPLSCASDSFERLEEFILNNIKQSICLEKLIELADMSAPALYELFKKHAGTTPMRFIRQRKLEAVYAHLSNPDSAVRSVTEAAIDYGFLHLGRFADNYKYAFGELPSETLRRTRAEANLIN